MGVEFRAPVRELVRCCDVSLWGPRTPCVVFEQIGVGLCVRRSGIYVNRPRFPEGAGGLEQEMAAKVTLINDLNFDQEVLKSTLPVLVDFSAEWCGPCKALVPILEQLAVEMDGKAKVVTIDVEESPGTAGKFGVSSMPTLLVFKNGAVSAKHIGRTTKQKLKELIES